MDVKQNNGDAHGDVRRRNLGYASVQAREAGWLGDENSMDILWCNQASYRWERRGRRNPVLKDKVCDGKDGQI